MIGIFKGTGMKITEYIQFANQAILYLGRQTSEVNLTAQFLWEWILNCCDSGLKPTFKENDDVELNYFLVN